MKVYERKRIIRIDANKGSKRASVSLEDCTLDEAVSFVQGLVMRVGSPLPDGKRTSMVVREYFDKLGPSKSVSCYGIEPEEIVKIIKEELS